MTCKFQLLLDMRTFGKKFMYSFEILSYLNLRNGSNSNTFSMFVWSCYILYVKNKFWGTFIESTPCP